jgi:soluble lytic murein transglycosylase-like protein
MEPRLKLLLMFVGLAALSCGTFGSEEPTATQLPHVSAMPPVPAAATSPRYQNHRDVAPEQTARSFLEAQVLAQLLAHHTGLSPEELPFLARTIVDEAEQHDIEPALVMAVIKVESAYYHRAVSPVGALGLMQLLPSTAKELALRQGLPWRGPDTLFDPVLNVKLGVAYLDYLENKFGEMPAALAAYNWGPRRIRERLQRGSALPEEYLRRVMTSYSRSEVKVGST